MELCTTTVNEISARDEKGNPTQVYINDGFCQTSRPYVPETDGWMENQLNVYDFPEIRTAQRIQDLVFEVNSLRREVFRLQQAEKKWYGAFFGKASDA